MKVYVVYCHPNAASFTAAVFERSVAALTASGHQVRTSDLYADGFEPALSDAEWRDHPLVTRPTPEVVAYCADLQWCEALVLVYPTWWSGLPAMLSGWLDRVLVRGVAWETPAGGSRITGRLNNVRRLVAITTHGSSKWVNLAEGESGRHVIRRALRLLCHRFASTRWIAMYNMDRSTFEQRTAFLDRVEERMRRL